MTEPKQPSPVSDNYQVKGSSISSKFDFVHRGWYGGESLQLAPNGPELERRLEAKEAHIESLTRRLSELEKVVEALAPGNATFRTSYTTEDVSDVQFAAGKPSCQLAPAKAVALS